MEVGTCTNSLSLTHTYLCVATPRHEQLGKCFNYFCSKANVQSLVKACYVVVVHKVPPTLFHSLITCRLDRMMDGLKRTPLFLSYNTHRQHVYTCHSSTELVKSADINFMYSDATILALALIAIFIPDISLSIFSMKSITNSTRRPWIRKEMR